MSEFIFSTDQDGYELCMQIVDAMMTFFAISEQDAVDRVNTHWQHKSITKNDIVFHETPEYWAKWIFYGDDLWRSSGLQRNEIQASLTRIEKRLILISGKLDVSEPSISKQIQVLLQQGKRIEAIKIYRDESGADLNKAKEVIEAIGNTLSLE